MTVVNQTIAGNLNSDVALINQLGAYIVQAGGKRLRPVALLLTAKAADPEHTEIIHNQTLLAAIIEFIHTATCMMTWCMNLKCAEAEKPPMKYLAMPRAY